MKATESRLSVIGLCAALIAGCGGGAGTTGGGGGGNNSTTVTFTFGGLNMQTEVAAKIGTGAFTPQTLSGNTLTLTIPSGTSNYAMAYVCSGQVSGLPAQFEYVWEASISDGTSPGQSCPVVSQTGTLTGSLDATAIGGVQSFQIIAQNAGSLTSDSQGGGPSVVFSQPAPVGNDRVLVVAYNGQAAVAARNFDNQTVPGALNGSNTVVFGAADETSPEAITYNNAPTGFFIPSTSVSLAVEGGAQAVYYGVGFGQYPALPASATENGDAYFLEASAVASGSSSSEVVAETTNSGGPVSFTFPDPWSYAGPTPAALPSFTIGYTGFAGKTNVVQDASIEWRPGSGAGTAALDLISVDATANYQGGSTTLAVPDLSGVAGFLAPPTSGTDVTWFASMWQQSYGLWSKTPLNSTTSLVDNHGSYTVP